MFFQENLWLKFINLLSGFILITVIWSMINQIMKVSINLLKVFNIMLPLQSLVLLKEHLEYNEIGLGSLKFRRWFRKLFIFLKNKSTGLPSYFFDIIPKSSYTYNTRSGCSNVIHQDWYLQVFVFFVCDIRME